MVVVVAVTVLVDTSTEVVVDDSEMTKISVLDLSTMTVGVVVAMADAVTSLIEVTVTISEAMGVLVTMTVAGATGGSIQLQTMVARSGSDSITLRADSCGESGLHFLMLRFIFLLGEPVTSRRT